MNQNDFDVPPMIEVPPDVRDRIEARVLPHLTDERDGPRTKVWLAAAAAVVVLAGLVVALTARSHRDEVEPAPAPSSSGALDRCWAAVQLLSGVARFPDRAQWRPVLSVDGPKSTILAFETADRPLFCEVTAAKVTLSDPRADPAYAQGTKTGVTFITDNGAVAGVADPSWPSVVVDVKAQNKDGYSGPAQVKDGVFVFISVVSTVEGEFAVRPGQGAAAISVPRPAPPLTAPNSGFPRADRTSPEGKLLDECISKAGGGIDADTWNAAVVVEAGKERLIMVTNPGGTGACYQQNQRAQLMSYLTTTLPAAKPEPLPIAPTLGDRVLVAGVVPAGVTRLQLITNENNSPVEAKLGSNTFAALLPPNRDVVSCKMFGAQGQVIYEGPIGG
jgi:hypothetical protein